MFVLLLKKRNNNVLPSSFVWILVLFQNTFYRLCFQVGRMTHNNTENKNKNKKEKRKEIKVYATFDNYCMTGLFLFLFFFFINQ